MLTELPVKAARQYQTSSGLIKVRVRECRCGAEVVQPLSQMMDSQVLLDAEPAAERGGRLLTLLLVRGDGPRSVLVCRLLGPGEVGRLAKMELFREHSCEGQVAWEAREGA
jgi:hypothetical protein